jgi:hypothetical protein
VTKLETFLGIPINLFYIRQNMSLSLTNLSLLYPVQLDGNLLFPLCLLRYDVWRIADRITYNKGINIEVLTTVSDELTE